MLAVGYTLKVLLLVVGLVEVNMVDFVANRNGAVFQLPEPTGVKHLMPLSIFFPLATPSPLSFIPKLLRRPLLLCHHAPITQAPAKCNPVVETRARLGLNPRRESKDCKRP